jgi:hypothetical protein
VTDPAGVAFSALQEVIAGPLRALHAGLPADARAKGPKLDQFDLHGDGLSAYVLAQRSDDRYLFWQIEVWLPAEFPPDDWHAVIKGEVDLDDVEGDPRCVLNEQLSATSAEELVVAIRDLAELVCAYPVAELMTMPPPSNEDEDED